MPVAKIAVSLERKTLKELDGLVKRGVFPSRSRAIQEALEAQIGRLGRGRLAAECAKLDPQEERKVAEEGMEYESEEWPEY